MTPDLHRLAPSLVGPFVETHDPEGAFCDIAGLVVLLLGAVLCLCSAIGVARLEGVYARMHAATKPQVLGVLLVLLGIGLRLRDPSVVGLLLLVGACQLLTIPASAQLLARAHLHARRDHPDGVPADAEPATVPEGPR